MGRPRKGDQFLPKRVYRRSGSYYFVGVDSKWINLGRSYPKAMAEYAKLVDDGGQELSTMGDVIGRYLREVAPGKAEATFKGNVYQAKFLKEVFGDVRPGDITPQHIYRYLDLRGRKSEVQANREFALLSHIFKKAIRWGVVESNPCRDIEKFKERPRERYIEDNEYLAFREFAGADIAAYMDLKYLTGLRRSDMLSLRLSDLQDDGIHVTVNKTGKRIIISWTPQLRAAVEAVKKLKRPIRGLHLFCTRKGQPYTPSGFSSIWQRKMRKALADGVLQERFTEHDIRAKTASDSKNLEHARKLLAHLDGKITEKVYRSRKAEIVEPLK